MLDIRKIHVATEELRNEMGRAVDPPMTTIIVAVVMTNPWAGQGYVEDLRPAIKDFSHDLGSLLAERLVEAAGSAEAIDCYGKASMVGVDGELEHANAMVHTLLFGNPIRDAVDGASTLVFANTRSAPGAVLTVPMVSKSEMLMRSHYNTAQTWIADAPRADEVVVALAGATRGRPFPRIGNRDIDRADLGLD